MSTAYFDCHRLSNLRPPTVLGVALAVGHDTWEVVPIADDPLIDVILKRTQEGYIVQPQEPGPAEADNPNREKCGCPTIARSMRVHGPGGRLTIGIGQAGQGRQVGALERDKLDVVMLVKTLHERHRKRSEVSSAIKDEEEGGGWNAHGTFRLMIRIEMPRGVMTQRG